MRLGLSLSEGLGSAARYQRKALWLANGFDGKVHVELRPIQVIFRWPLNFRELLDRGLLEPRKIGARHGQLLVSQQQPEAINHLMGVS